MHVAGQWTCAIDNKKTSIEATKKNHWWCAIMVYAQVVKNWIKTRMKKPICLNNKGNEIITYCLLNIWSCLFLSSHHCCMCWHHWCLLHHIYVSWIINDDVHQGPKVIFGDRDIHSSSSVAREEVGDLVNMCFTLQNNNCDNILNVSCYYVHSHKGTKAN